MADVMFDDDEDEAYGFWLRAEADPTRRLLVEPDGTEHTAEDLFNASNRLVHGLRDLGLETGDVVAAMLPNSAAFAELVLACQQGGLYFVPINYHFKSPEVTHIVEDSDAKVFVTHERFAEVCREVGGNIALDENHCFAVGDIEGFSSYPEFRDSFPDEPPEDRVAGALMTYTSGSSGKPKGVKRPLPDFDPDMQGEVLQIANELFGLGEADGVHLVTGPLYHTAVGGLCMAALHAGNTVVLMDEFDPEDWLRLVETYRVSTTHMVPTMFVRLMKLPDEVRSKYDLSSLTQVSHGAAPCPQSIKRAMLDWLGPVVTEYYAASEGGGTIASPEEWLERPGTVGRPWPISKIKITDDEGTELPPGEVGPIWIKMQVGGIDDFEYHGDAAKTKFTYDDEGFFTVGDMGYLDDDGYLYVCDRQIDMIISGGVNIYPAEVEDALVGHPKVRDVAVFGIPDDEWGEQVKAAVEVLDPADASPELEAELIQYSRDQIAHLKCPKSVDFTELPRDPNGKVYKRQLRDPYWEGLDRHV